MKKLGVVVVILLVYASCVSSPLEQGRGEAFVPTGLPWYAQYFTAAHAGLWNDLAQKSALPADLANRVRNILVFTDRENRTVLLVSGDLPMVAGTIGLASASSEKRAISSQRTAYRSGDTYWTSFLTDGLLALSPSFDALVAYVEWHESGDASVGDGLTIVRTSEYAQLQGMRNSKTVLLMVADLSRYLRNVGSMRLHVTNKLNSSDFEVEIWLAISGAANERQSRSAARIIVLQAFTLLGLELDYSAVEIESYNGEVHAWGFTASGESLAASLQTLVQGQGIR